MELDAGLGANGRRHFCRRRAGKRAPLIGCVRARGRFGRRAYAARFLNSSRILQGSAQIRPD